MNVLYQNALAEVDAVLQLMEKDLLNKIPDTFMKFIEQKKSKSYIPNLNMDVSLKEQNLLKETKNILSLIYRTYLCSPEKSTKLKIDDDMELKMLQTGKDEKYSYENFFHKTKI